ncbi:MAG: 3D domain-containing protein [Bacillales bacterium]
MLLTHSLLSPPSIVAGELASVTAPNATIWRHQAEVLTNENERLRDEIKRLEASQWRDFTATAYTADCSEGCSGITKTGLDVRHRTHVDGLRIIATDPSVIPLGSIIEIRFSNGKLERAIAADTGGAIDGHLIDYLISDNASAIQFGRQHVQIRIIEEESE